MGGKFAAGDAWSGGRAEGSRTARARRGTTALAFFRVALGAFFARAVRAAACASSASTTASARLASARVFFVCLKFFFARRAASRAAFRLRLVSRAFCFAVWTAASAAATPARACSRLAASLRDGVAGEGSFMSDQVERFPSARDTRRAQQTKNDGESSVHAERALECYRSKLSGFREFGQCNDSRKSPCPLMSDCDPT